jgi:CHAT domain-containing protein
LHSRAKPFTSRQESLVIAPVTFKDPKVNSLPSSEIEAVNISTMLENKGYNNTLYTFNNASEENFRSPKSSAYEFIHLATHGLVNPDKPDLSAIYLNSATDSTQDGKLYVGEIYNLKLNTNLLCLSACETGIGKYSRGEGILGLGRAFSYAGAQKIVVSLWNVNDASTAIFMENFYSNTIAQENVNIALSLQKAKSTMINGVYNNPYYWAPFVMWGK